MKKIFLLLIIFLTGCSNNIINNKEISDSIIEYYQTGTYDSTKLSSSQYQKVENYIDQANNIKINLNDFMIYDDEYKTNEQNTTGVYVENNNCYINSNDINFIENSDQSYEFDDNARIVCNGYFTVLTKDTVLSLDNTNKIKQSDYRFLGYYEDNGDNFVYRSYENGSGLIVNISDEITLNFTNVDNLTLQPIDESSNDLLFPIIIVILGIGVLLIKKELTTIKKVFQMNKVTKVLLVSSITNIFLSIIKLIFGFIGKSSALIADGIHSFSDLSTDIIAILGNKLALKPADKEHPFGHGKTEYITSMIIGVIIIILGLGLINEVFNKEITIPSILVVIVSIFTIISKYIVSYYIYKKGVEYKNNILIASGKESRTDVYSSIFVFVSIILMQFSNAVSIFRYADLVGTIVIAILIIHTGYRVLMDNVSILLEEQIIDKDYIKEIKKIILSFNEIKGIGELHILRYGPYYKLLANVRMNDKILLSEAHEIIDKLENSLKKHDNKIKYVYIHMEPQN